MYVQYLKDLRGLNLGECTISKWTIVIMDNLLRESSYFQIQGLGLMSQWFTSPNSWGYFISNRYGCFGDVKQIPKSWDINPKPCNYEPIPKNPRFPRSSPNDDPIIPWTTRFLRRKDAMGCWMACWGFNGMTF